MSSKSSHILTNDHNGHWFDDCNAPIGDSGYYELTLEFAKENIRIEQNDDKYLTITFIKECELLDLLIRCNLRELQ